MQQQRFKMPSVLNFQFMLLQIVLSQKYYYPETEWSHFRISPKGYLQLAVFVIYI